MNYLAASHGVSAKEFSAPFSQQAAGNSTQADKKIWCSFLKLLGVQRVMFLNIPAPCPPEAIPILSLPCFWPFQVSAVSFLSSRASRR